MMPTIRVMLMLGLLAAGSSLTACATVQPWQRSLLAKSSMQFNPDPALTSFTGHWQESREGAAGGLGLQGGGCGCK